MTIPVGEPPDEPGSWTKPPKSMNVIIPCCLAFSCLKRPLFNPNFKLCFYNQIPDNPFEPATVVEVNKDDADDALQPRGEEPSPEELEEAVEEEDADLPTFGRPNSPFPPSDNGLPDPIIVDVPIDPSPDDSLRLPFDTLSLFASQEIFPVPFPFKMDVRAAFEPEPAPFNPPLRLSLSIEGVGDVGPPM